MPALCVIPGDGIGGEVIPVALAVLRATVPDLHVVSAEAGWNCFLRCGTSVPQETLDAARACGAVLFGAVSSPSHRVAGYRSAILTLRQGLGLYANIRPITSLPPIAPRPGIEMVIVRENSEGLYAGRERLEEGGDTAIAERVITRHASTRIGRIALDFCLARPRRRLTIVHKANVLPLTDGLFRDSVRAVTAAAEAQGQLQVDELLVDVAALKLVAEPERFDVIVTTNLFGDILSDLAAWWGGGLGFAPSLNQGEGCALAEPVHGSAPDIAGQGIANPIAAVLSAALLVRHTWGLPETADRIESAVAQTLAHHPPATRQTTAEIGAALLQRL